MSFESPILTWLVLAVIFAGLPALLAVAAGAARLFHVKSALLPFLLFVALAFLVVFGISSYLDSAGDNVIAEVLQKEEGVAYHRDGSWRRQMQADVKYRPSDAAPPVTERLSLRQIRFDEMHNGDFVKVRFIDRPGLFRFTRLEDQSTYSQLWALAADQPFFLIVIFGLLIVVAAGLVFRLGVPMLFFLTGLCIIIAWWTSDVGIPLGKQTAIRVASLDTVNANVKEIHQPYLGNGARAWIFDKLFIPYQLILLDMTPLGRSEPLMSIDVVDRGSASVRPGETIAVQYSPGNPRLAMVADAARKHLWRNGMVETVFALAALLAVAGVALLLREQTFGLVDWWLMRSWRRP
jgi:hypothetical protein